MDYDSCYVCGVLQEDAEGRLVFKAWITIPAMFVEFTRLLESISMIRAVAGGVVSNSTNQSLLMVSV